MIRSIRFVVSENSKNLYRIYSIAKYEIIAENRDSKLGILWNILNPLIQIFTYWFAFGLGIRGGKDVNGIDYFSWMLGGLVVWFLISPSITEGVNSIYKKNNVITKMKFPISILPTTIVVKEVFNHFFMLIAAYLVFLIRGISPSIYNLQVVYYLFCAVAFSISLAMITSVLNMFTRDVRKIVAALIRMLLYITPILWTMEKVPFFIQKIMKYNPIFYIVEGYRDSFFYHKGILNSTNEMIIFWIIVFIMFVIGSMMLYKFKHKFIDFI